LPQLIAAFFITWLLILSPFQVFGGEIANNGRHHIALDFSGNSQYSPTQEQLDFANSLGIQLISFSDPGRFNHLSIEAFSIMLRSEIIFPTSFNLYSQRDSYRDQLLEKYRRAADLFPGQITAVGVFSYPNEKDPLFSGVAAQISSALSQQIEEPLFYNSVYPEQKDLPGGIRFRVIRLEANQVNSYQSGSYLHFFPSDSERETLAGLDHLFTQTGDLSNVIIFLPAPWFFDLIERNPDFGIIISSYLEGNRIPIPIPAEKASVPPMNWSVFFLFLLWISFVVHFRYQPTYAQNLSRYFLNHTFYVIDVMEHRIRNALPGIIILIQHALLTGLFLAISADVLISGLGLNALSYHFPYLFFLGNPLISLFALGVFIALILQLISVGWIFILNKQMKFLSQTLNLYSWPLHINLVIFTFLVVMNQTGSADVWVFSLSILFAIVWFLSFNVAAINGAGFLDRYKILNIFLTAGIHTLLIAFAIWFIIYTPSLIEPIRMALSFP
jgi:hypothetical protein